MKFTRVPRHTTIAAMALQLVISGLIYGSYTLSEFDTLKPGTTSYAVLVIDPPTNLYYPTTALSAGAIGQPARFSIEKVSTNGIVLARNIPANILGGSPPSEGAVYRWANGVWEVSPLNPIPFTAGIGYPVDMNQKGTIVYTIDTSTNTIQKSQLSSAGVTWDPGLAPQQFDRSTDYIDITWPAGSLSYDYAWEEAQSIYEYHTITDNGTIYGYKSYALLQGFNTNSVNYFSDVNGVDAIISNEGSNGPEIASDAGTIYKPDDTYTNTFNGATIPMEAIAMNNDGVIVGSSTSGKVAWMNISGDSSKWTVNELGTNNNSAQYVNTREYIGTNGSPVPDYQIIDDQHMLWQQTRDTNGVPTGTYAATPLDLTVPQEWSSVAPADINDQGAIIGSATYTPTGPTDPITAGSHNVLLLPCQFSLLNGNQSGTDGLNFDGRRPQTVSATGSDNTTVGLDIEALNGGTLTSIDVLGTVIPMGAGRRDFPGACYTASLVVTAKVLPTSAMTITYAWDRTVNTHAVLIHWNSVRWNVIQSYYLAAHEDDTVKDYQTQTPSPNNQLYIFDNPALDIYDDFDSADVGDYAYLESDFTYTLTITVGTAAPTKSTIHVGQTTLAKRVSDSTGTIAGDWQGIENIVSTSNVPTCQITFDKIHNIVGFLPLPSLQISIPANINIPTGS